MISASVASLVTSVAPLFSMSSHGDSAMTAPGSGLPRSRSASAVATARLPPAESPMVAMSSGATPFSVSARKAATASSRPAGCGCSGARR